MMTKMECSPSSVTSSQYNETFIQCYEDSDIIFAHWMSVEQHSMHAYHCYLPKVDNVLWASIVD